MGFVVSCFVGAKRLGWTRWITWHRRRHCESSVLVIVHTTLDYNGCDVYRFYREHLVHKEAQGLMVHKEQG